MPQTPDRFPGVSDQEGIDFEESPDGAADAPGKMRYHNGAFSLYDDEGEFDPREVQPHAPTHEDGGSDELTAQDLGSGDAVSSKVMVTTGSGGWVLQNAAGAGFGTFLVTAESESLSGTTSGTYQQKLTMTTDDLPLGNYILLFQMLVTGTSNNTRTQVRVQRDNTEDVADFIVRLVIAAGAYQSAGHKVFFGISGVHTFDVDWRRDGGSGTAQIQWVRMAFWRIS